MKRAQSPLIFMILSSLALTAVSARASEVEVNLERSHLELSKIRLEKKTPSPVWMEMGVSSWIPRNFSLPGRITSESPYQSNGIPALYGSILFPVSNRNIKTKLGMGAQGLSRRASLNSGGVYTPESQTTYLFSIKAGAEYTPTRFLETPLSPYLSAALIPSFAVSGRSTLDDGSVYFGVPIEISLGSRLRLNSIGISWNNAEFDLGMLGTVGTIKGSSLAGLGINGGIKVQL